MNKNKIMQNVSSFFQFENRKTTFKKEILGGISTFMAMAYILAVNPGILSNANGAKDYTGVFFLGTAISTIAATLAMGLIANVPVALAPGMGINAFFAYTVAGRVLNMQVEQALICTFISGLLYAIIALTPARKYIAKILPKNIKLAIGAMIGLFLAYIGLNNSGIIVSDAILGDKNTIISHTHTKLGSFKDPLVIIALITILLVFALHFMKIPGAALIAMVAAIIMLAIAMWMGVSDVKKAFQLGTYNTFNEFDKLSNKMWTSFGSTLSNGKAYIAIFVFLYIDFFDTTGTLFAIDEQTQLSKTDKKWLIKANAIDAGGTIFGSLMLTSTTTSYIESSVGVSQGAKTGFASVVTAILFGISIIAWPIMQPLMPIAHAQAGIPSTTNATIMPITGPILVLVGSLMLSQLKNFDWKQTIDIPVLFTIILIGVLGFSIAAGIAAGIIIFYILNLAVGLAQVVHPQREVKLNINKKTQISSTKNLALKKQLLSLKNKITNPIMIALFILSVVYFATMPLYA